MKRFTIQNLTLTLNNKDKINILNLEFKNNKYILYSAKNTENINNDFIKFEFKENIQITPKKKMNELNLTTKLNEETKLNELHINNNQIYYLKDSRNIILNNDKLFLILNDGKLYENKKNNIENLSGIIRSPVLSDSIKADSSQELHGSNEVISKSNDIVSDILNKAKKSHEEVKNLRIEENTFNDLSDSNTKTSSKIINLKNKNIDNDDSDENKQHDNIIIKKDNNEIIPSFDIPKSFNNVNKPSPEQVSCESTEFIENNNNVPSSNLKNNDLTTVKENYTNFIVDLESLSSPLNPINIDYESSNNDLLNTSIEDKNNALSNSDIKNIKIIDNNLLKYDIHKLKIDKEESKDISQKINTNNVDQLSNKEDYQLTDDNNLNGNGQINDQLSNNDTLIDNESNNNTLIDDRSNNNTLIDNKSNNNTLIDNRSNNDTLIDNQPINDTLIDNESNNNTLIDNQPINDRPPDNQPNNNPSNDISPLQESKIKNDKEIFNLEKILTDFNKLFNIIDDNSSEKSTVNEKNNENLSQPILNLLEVPKKENIQINKNIELKNNIFKSEIKKEIIITPEDTIKKKIILKNENKINKEIIKNTLQFNYIKTINYQNVNYKIQTIKLKSSNDLNYTNLFKTKIEECNTINKNNLSFELDEENSSYLILFMNQKYLINKINNTIVLTNLVIRNSQIIKNKDNFKIGLYDFILYNNASIIIAASTSKFFDNNYGTAYNVYIPLYI
jgi:hypothetical protein